MQEVVGVEGNEAWSEIIQMVALSASLICMNDLEPDDIPLNFSYMRKRVWVGLRVVDMAMHYFSWGPVLIYT